MASFKKTSKRLILGFGILFFLLVAAALVIPLVVDVDHYRPRLVQLANQHINGRLELGKLELSLWGRIRVRIAGLKVSDPEGVPLLEVKDAAFLLPFTSLIGGAPSVMLELRKPVISVARDSKGRLNVAELAPPAAPAPAPSGAAQPGGAPDTAKDIVLPGIVARARLGLRVQDGSLSYSDASAATRATIQGLDLDWSNASLSQPSRMKLGFRVDTQVGLLAQVQGPVRVQMDSQPMLQKGSLSQLAVELTADAGDLDVRTSAGFKKPKGVPLSVSAKLGASPTEIRLDALKAVFHKAELSAAGKVRLAEGPVVDLKFRSNSIDLKPFEELVEMLKPYQLAGKALIEGELNGPSSALQYSGALQVDGVGFSMPQFKKNPSIGGKLAFSTDRIDSLDFKLTAPGTEISLKGSLAGFLKPSVTLAVASPGIDLDQWIEFPPAATTGSTGVPESKVAQESKGSKGGKGVKAPELDSSLDPLRANPIARAAQGRFTVQIRQLKARKVVFSDLAVSAKMLPGLVFQLDQASLKAYGGSMRAKAKVELLPAAPAYSFAGELKGLDLQKAVESQFSMFRNTLLGNLSASVTGSGSSLDPARAMERLKLSGNFSVAEGRFATLDIGRIAVDGINEALAKAGDKIPALKGRQLNVTRGRETRYQVIRSKFQMAGGKFVAPDFAAVAAKDAGIDINGSLKMDLIRQDMDAHFELIDTYNLTQAQDVSIEIADQKIEHVLAEKGKPVRFPVTIGCRLAQPCPNYGELPEHFAKVAGANLASGAAAKAKSEIKKQVEGILKGAPLPGGIKKLFR